MKKKTHDCCVLYSNKIVRVLSHLELTILCLFLGLPSPVGVAHSLVSSCEMVHWREGNLWCLLSCQTCHYSSHTLRLRACLNIILVLNDFFLRFLKIYLYYCLLTAMAVIYKFSGDGVNHHPLSPGLLQKTPTHLLASPLALL